MELVNKTLDTEGEDTKSTKSLFKNSLCTMWPEAVS
jgi:hypothetical protein